MEVGVGIHGEPGRRRAKASRRHNRRRNVRRGRRRSAFCQAETGSAVMINGLGGTPISELVRALSQSGLELPRTAASTVVRNYVGNYCTSLEMRARR